MSSNFGKYIEISVFGESHGEAIGVTINGLPAGENIDVEEINEQLARRAPGRDKSTTPRKEKDEFKFLSGVLNGKTTGAPVCAVIENTNTRSGDYGNIALCPRPSHSDYAAFVKYDGFNDIRGGGHFSGRLTAPIVIAGSICRQILERRGIIIGGHIKNIGPVFDAELDRVNIDGVTLDRLNKQFFALVDPEKETPMRDEIEAARMDRDSIGGSVEIAVAGLPAGVGAPMFGGAENIIAHAVYGIPAVKSVAFGAGADFALMRGSKANDQMEMRDGKVVTLTNNNGGITGGITNGMPVVFTAVIKPTSSISLPQKSVDLDSMTDTTLEVHGRHDPCIVTRALPAIEAITAVAIANLMSGEGLL